MGGALKIATDLPYEETRAVGRSMIYAVEELLDEAGIKGPEGGKLIQSVRNLSQQNLPSILR